MVVAVYPISPSIAESCMPLEFWILQTQYGPIQDQLKYLIINITGNVLFCECELPKHPFLGERSPQLL